MVKKCKRDQKRLDGKCVSKFSYPFIKAKNSIFGEKVSLASIIGISAGALTLSQAIVTRQQSFSISGGMDGISGTINVGWMILGAVLIGIGIYSIYKSRKKKR